MDQEQELGQDFSFASLGKFVAPSIFTFVFIAVYQMVDGLFIERFVGEMAISAINLYYPIISLFIAIGVMIGYWGEEKRLAALIPSSPEQYRAVLAGHPQSIPVDDEAAKQISRDAFACYAGFPARALKLLDLLKFMFRQCWKADYRAIILTSLSKYTVKFCKPYYNAIVQVLP